MKKTFMTRVLLLLGWILLLVSIYFVARKASNVENIIESRFDSMNLKFDSVHKADMLRIKQLMNRLDSLNLVETTIINNSNEKKNAILDGSISDDDVAKFISSEIYNRRQELLLLPD